MSWMSCVESVKATSAVRELTTAMNVANSPKLTASTPHAIAAQGSSWPWVMSNAIESGDAADLDELPVRLSFELGRLELPLAEGAVLGVGHVFELAREETQPVDIVANGRRIGRGRIVTVAGSIGVQIVRIGQE